MNQLPVTLFASACKKASAFVENDMPIGAFHDFLMQLKGLMVERMIIAHNEQEAAAKAALEQPPHDSELPSANEDQTGVVPQPYCEDAPCEAPQEALPPSPQE